MAVDPEVLRAQYEVTIEALEDELEREKQRSAKCRIAKAAVETELHEKRALLTDLSFTLEQHRSDIVSLMTSLEKLASVLPQATE